MASSESQEPVPSPEASQWAQSDPGNWETELFALATAVEQTILFCGSEGDKLRASNPAAVLALRDVADRLKAAVRQLPQRPDSPTSLAADAGDLCHDHQRALKVCGLLATALAKTSNILTYGGKPNAKQIAHLAIDTLGANFPDASKRGLAQTNVSTTITDGLRALRN